MKFQDRLLGTLGLRREAYHTLHPRASDAAEFRKLARKKKVNQVDLFREMLSRYQQPGDPGLRQQVSELERKLIEVSALLDIFREFAPDFYPTKIDLARAKRKVWSEAKAEKGLDD